MNIILKIDGMSCEHCVARVKKALLAVDGVTEVTVDLGAKSATVTADEGVKTDSLKIAVEDAGYTVL